MVIFILLLLSVLVISAVLARRNQRIGRGDRRGASRLATFVFVAWTVAEFFAAHHVASSSELGVFIEYLAWGLGWSCFMWVLYIALELYVRRRWPATLVSWSRLIAGDFRDPVVVRDILVGCLLAAFTLALPRFGWFIPAWLGYPPSLPGSGPEWQLLGAQAIVAHVALALMFAPFFWLALLFILFLFRGLLRKDWAAAVAWVLLFTLFFPLSYDPVGWGGALIFSVWLCF